VRVCRAAEAASFAILVDATWKDWSFARDSYGSGVGFRRDGWILTAAHVVRDAKTLTVYCPDGAARGADVWYWLKDMDIAVVHVPDYALPTAKFARSEPLGQGSTVYIVGRPHAFEGSIARGVLSGKHRNLRVDGKVTKNFQDYLQTDAQANPGSSGGGLYNEDAEVVGIVVERLPDSPAMSVAVPSDVALRMADRLIEEKDHVRHAGLGANLVDCYGLPLEVRRKIGCDRTNGVVLSDLEPSVKAAGLAEGDVVVAMDGTSVETWMHLRVLIALHKPKDRVVLSIERKGAPSDISVELGSWER